MATKSAEYMVEAALRPPVTEVEESIRRHACQSLAKVWNSLSTYEIFTAVALSVQELLIQRMLETEERYRHEKRKRVHYISMEFLSGKSLRNHLNNLGIREIYGAALRNLHADLDAIEQSEEEPPLGNGGLGRLAVCLLDSMATMGIPGYGYGIHYEYGMFKQEIENGCQREKPQNWLVRGCPWEIVRAGESCMVPLYGRIEHGTDRSGGYNPMWMDWKTLVGVPYDMLVSGYGGRTVNRIRLYAARSSHDFDMQIFNEGDYFKAVEQKIASETVSKVLYPSDAITAGRELRLVQEYFLVACAMRDIVRGFERENSDFRQFPAKVAVQLNDTHPALCVAELMRILVDEKSLGWDDAWNISQATLAYTNHTMAAEALERWPVTLLEQVVPRHLQIIYEIDRRFVEQATASGKAAGLRNLSIVEESQPRQVRMQNLAVIGCHAVNGVSGIHAELLKQSMSEFYTLWPERFCCITNGISQRRWLVNANPRLAELISAAIGPDWISDLAQLRALEPLAHHRDLQAGFQNVKQSNKERLAHWIHEKLGIIADPASMFDIQAKRIHLYKRQLLNLLHIVYEYASLIDDSSHPAVPRTYIFSGKAAPGYWAAKQVIRLIHEIGRVINSAPQAQSRMKVVFLPDYNVSLAEQIIPAADLSEQISAAGMEASGTGNMKFALNGALMIGSRDGANLEIMGAVAAENTFMFGLTPEQTQILRRPGASHPMEYLRQDVRLQRTLDSLSSSLFRACDPDLLRWAAQILLDPGDPYCHLADFGAYLDAHTRADAAFIDRSSWNAMSILNVARMGRFSSDRAVAEYAARIWGI